MNGDPQSLGVYLLMNDPQAITASSGRTPSQPNKGGLTLTPQLRHCKVVIPMADDLRALAHLSESRGHQGHLLVGQPTSSKDGPHIPTQAQPNIVLLISLGHGIMILHLSLSLF